MVTLVDFQNLLYQATDLHQLEKALTLGLKPFNITYFAFTYYTRHPNSINKLKYEFSSHDYKAWHQYYLSEHFEDVDPTMNDIIKSNLPIFWDVAHQLKK